MQKWSLSIHECNLFAHKPRNFGLTLSDLKRFEWSRNKVFADDE